MHVKEQWELKGGKEYRAIDVFVHSELDLAAAIRLRDELTRAIDHMRRALRKRTKAQGMEAEGRDASSRSRSDAP